MAMIYVKAVGVGLLSAVAAVMVLAAVMLIGRLLYASGALLRYYGSSEGDFAGGTVISVNVAAALWLILIVLIAGFATGAWRVLSHAHHSDLAILQK